MSPHLYQFYVAYAAWVDANAPDNGVFTGRDGLCDNLHYYTNGTYNIGPIGLDDFKPSGRYVSEMRTAFMKAGLDRLYPFNPWGESEYADECNRAAAHFNPRRIAWVREQIEKGAEHNVT